MRALQHAYPQWEPPEDDPTAMPEDFREVWCGKMRIVHRQRARKLRRRGVPLMHLGYGDGTTAQQERSPKGNLVPFGPWAWFVEPKPLSSTAIINGALREIGKP